MSHRDSTKGSVLRPQFLAWLSPQLLRAAGLFVVVGWALRTAWLAALYAAAAQGVARHHVETAGFILAALLLATLMVRRSLPPSTSNAAVETSNYRFVWLYLVASFLLYLPALDIGLLSDDFALLQTAASGDLLDPNWEFVRPIPLAVWLGLDYLLPTAWTPVGLHVLNVALHGLNASLVAVLASTLGFNRTQPAVAGIAFLVFPLSVEAVVWASAIFDVLLCTAVLTICLLVPGTDRISRARLCIIAALTLFALGSKETAVAVPALVGIVAIHKHGWSSRATVAIVGVTSAIVATYVGWRLARGLGTTDFPPFTGYQAKELLSRPIAALAMPFHSNVRDALRIQVALAVAAVPLLATLHALHRKPDRSISRIGAIAWVFAAAAPVFTLLHVTPDLQAARYLYIPTVGWALFLGGAFVPLPKRLHATAVVVAGALLVLYVVSVRMHLEPWEEAGHRRDEILASVAKIASHCPAITVTHLPDNIDGAYLFRNGFPEAVARAGVLSRLVSDDTRIDLPCRLNFRDQGR